MQLVGFVASELICDKVLCRGERASSVCSQIGQLDKTCRVELTPQLPTSLPLFESARNLDYKLVI